MQKTNLKWIHTASTRKISLRLRSEHMQRMPGGRARAACSRAQEETVALSQDEPKQAATSRNWTSGHMYI